MKTKIKLLIIFILAFIAMNLFSNKILASTLNRLGAASWSGTKVGLFEIDGKQAFCIDHKKTSPHTGLEFTKEVYNDMKVKKILYYGWTGPRRMVGFWRRQK